MSSSFPDLCSEFYNKTRYHLSLMTIIPNEKVMAEMRKEGWRLVSHTPTQDEIVAAATAGAGHGGLFLPKQTVKNAQGVDVFTDENAHKEYRDGMRRAAAKVYGLNI